MRNTVQNAGNGLNQDAGVKGGRNFKKSHRADGGCFCAGSGRHSDFYIHMDKNVLWSGKSGSDFVDWKKR